jgi:hypothetical protein
MNRNVKCLTLISLLILVAWSVASLTLGMSTAAAKYGADCCDDHCYYSFKYWIECGHGGPGDICESNRCILNTMKAAKCDPDEAGDDCPVNYDMSAWYMSQIERKHPDCDTDDLIAHVYPVVDWDECEYCSHLGQGSCLSNNGCYGDELPSIPDRLGNFVCQPN